MSSTTAPPSAGPAPWRSHFHEHIQKMDSPEFVFSSLHPAPKGSSTPYLPRARYCIFRGFWASLPENKHNDAPKNEAIYESDLPTFTTDVRMQKPFELFASSAGHADDVSLTQGSGGGGPCEAVWWVKDVMTQWRFRGEAYVVAPDIEGSGEESSGVRTVKSEVGKGMRVASGQEGREGEWSWTTEVTGHFGNLSPGMRGTFAQPPPGRPVGEEYEKGKLEMGRKIEGLEDEVARANFRVVVIKPLEVESLDLSDPAKARRQVYTLDEASGKWSHEETWP